MAEVIVALDVPGADEARALVRRIGDRGDFYKVGLELYTRAGPDFIRELRAAGKRVFLDLKLHDIPNTVASAVRAAVDLGVDLLTVHAVGGPSMLEAAVEAAGTGTGAATGAGAAAGPGAVSGEGASGLRLLAVTVLTSLDAEELGGVWGRPALSVPDEVRRLTALAVGARVHGVVCSAAEASGVRAAGPPELVIVTPGIRPAGADVGDQKRVATPAAAVRAGADYLVLGRAVTRAPDPAVALADILTEIETSAAAS